MKIRFTQNTLLDVFKSKLDETWDREFHKWSTINVERIEDLGNNTVNLILDNDDVILNVKKNTFEPISK